MKKIKIALIITLVLSIAFTGIYIIGYPKFAKKGNIDVEYASEIKDNKEEFPTEDFPNSSTNSTPEENLEIVTGYVQLIYTIETSENLKEGWMLVTIEDTLYNAYRNYKFFNENNELITLSEDNSDWPIFTDEQNNIYCLESFEFNDEEDFSIAKYWANETTYILIFPFNFIKNPPPELINLEGEASE